MSKRATESFDGVTDKETGLTSHELDALKEDLKGHTKPRIKRVADTEDWKTAQLCTAIDVRTGHGNRLNEHTADPLIPLPESSQGGKNSARIEAQIIAQTTRLNTMAEQRKIGGQNHFSSKNAAFNFIFSTTASPTPSLRKDSVSAKRSRNGRGMSAPCPAWLSASMSSPRPWAGNGQAMSVGSPQTVHVRVQSASASSPCPRQCPPHVRKSPCIVRRLAFSESENVRTGYALSPQRRLICDRWLATQRPDGVLGMSALWPVGVRAKST